MTVARANRFLVLCIGVVLAGCSDPFSKGVGYDSIEMLSTLYDRIILRVEVQGQAALEYSFSLKFKSISVDNTTRACDPGPKSLQMVRDFISEMGPNTAQDCNLVQIEKYYFSYEKDSVVTTSGCPVINVADKQRIQDLADQLWQRCDQ